MNIDIFSQYFSTLTDPRQFSKISYPLFDILFLTTTAIIAGAEGWEDIEDFGETYLDWYQKKELFPNGIPGHDSIARLISRLNPVEFHNCFIHWVQSVSERSEGEIIAIDGKTLRGTYDGKNRQSMLHMVSAFATQNGVVMGQLSTDKKSNEITAIPKLLRLLDIKGCLITIDAMGCQTKIAEQIVQQEGDYLLAVKGNQETLYRAVKKALAAPVSAVSHAKNITIEQGHGRIEAREYHVLPAQELAQQFPEWKNIHTVGVAIGYRMDNKGKESLDYRYYISSAELSPDKFAAAVRGHWGIETRLHWVLDVTMGEDACLIQRGESAEILGCMRHMSVNMLRAETTKKASIRRKRRFA
ncbi:ISAs1 family transposase, partial [Xenorhabdus kozodoii]|uniref:ISAs1 family transposase n=1 Tax=Xenorhabdus kozodoii TaxID=351676 RepID=UPI000C041A63